MTEPIIELPKAVRGQVSLTEGGGFSIITGPKAVYIRPDGTLHPPSDSPPSGRGLMLDLEESAIFLRLISEVARQYAADMLSDSESEATDE